MKSPALLAFLALALIAGFLAEPALRGLYQPAAPPPDTIPVSPSADATSAEKITARQSDPPSAPTALGGAPSIPETPNPEAVPEPMTPADPFAETKPDLPDEEQASPATTPATPPANLPEPAPSPTAPRADAVALMKEAIGTGTVDAVATGSVLDWKEAPDETIEGVTYQIGVISFTKDTFLGPKTMEAKALIRDGAIARWIWAKSGTELK